MKLILVDHIWFARWLYFLVQVFTVCLPACFCVPVCECKYISKNILSLDGIEESLDAIRSKYSLSNSVESHVLVKKWGARAKSV